MPTVSVALDGLTTTLQVDKGKTLYDELERQGTVLPHGCLAGSCGSCKVEVLQGAENLTGPSIIEADTLKNINDYAAREYGEEVLKGRVIRLSCRAKIQGDVSIRPLKLP